MLSKSKLLVCLMQAIGAAATAPTVRAGSVSYIGTISGGVESFLNISFGHDTSGQNRFKRPVPYSYPDGAIVNASTPGAACPQTIGNPLPTFEGIYGNTTSISEDCLTVRVSRPLGTCQQARLPVMAYLFGGGYAFGTIYDDVASSPDGLVRENGVKGLPVIYVAIK
jgi:carboxylesterase type B